MRPVQNWVKHLRFHVCHQVVTSLLLQLVTKFAMLDIKYRFTCGDSIQAWAKLLKSAKILWPGFSENFLLLSRLPMMIQLSGKSTRFVSKMLLCQKTTNRKSWNFSKVKLWPKPRTQNSPKIKPLGLEHLMQLTWYISWSWLEKRFEVTENVQKLKKTGPSFGQKFVCLDSVRKQSFNRNFARSSSHLNFLIFSVTSKHFSNHDQNRNQVSCVKCCKSNGFVLGLFCILGLGQNLTLENFQLCRLVLIWTN